MVFRGLGCSKRLGPYGPRKQIRRRKVSDIKFRFNSVEEKILQKLIREEEREKRKRRQKERKK